MITTDMGGSHDRTAPALSEEGLLLAEAHHRTANEVAAALAALRMARAGRHTKSREHLLDLALDRLEGFGRAHRMMGAPVPNVADAGAAVDAVCRAVLSGRFTVRPSTVMLDLPKTLAGGASVRRVTMIAHELVTNALKHAFKNRGGSLSVKLERAADMLLLTVSDDGPGFANAATSGTGRGSGIVTELVKRCGGTIQYETGTEGSTIRVALPFEPGATAKDMANA